MTELRKSSTEGNHHLKIEKEEFNRPEEAVIITDIATDKDDLEALASIKGMEGKNPN